MHCSNGSFLNISLLLFLSLACLGTAFSQSISCTADVAMHSYFKENPVARDSWSTFLQQSQNKKTLAQGCAQNYVIPTVFHVFHNDGPDSVPVSQLQSALQNANLDFQGLNSDFDDVNPVFKDIRGTLDITFALATLDPDGNPTTGVNYYPAASGLGSGANHPDIAQYAWDNYRYLNVYVLLDLYDDGETTHAGVSWFPSTLMSDDATARVVYNYQYLGDHGSSVADPEFQSVFTHVLGHWLGLSHTFANGCTGDGDGIADTPPTEGLSGCADDAMSCGNVVNRENYMAFSPCYRMFSKGQAARMAEVLNQHPARRSLWQWDNLEATGTEDFYKKGDLIAEFTTQNKTVTSGDEVCFTDISCGFPTEWEWTFEGGDIDSADQANPCIKYCEPGTYEVSLIVKNESGESAPYTLTISVLPAPGLQADFTASDTVMIAGTEVIFKDMSLGAVESWNWTLEGGDPATSNQQHPSSIFRAPGTYTITLTTSNCLGEVDSFAREVTVFNYDPTPFGCKPAFYQTINRNSSLLQYDASNVDVGFNWIADFGYEVNATAYNPLDNYIYTIQRYGVPNLIRVHADGSMVDLGDLNGLPGNVYVGDITATGEYYIKNGGNTVYKVDISTMQVTSFNTNITFAAADWAYRKQDNTLYGGGGNGTLYALDLTTQTVSAYPVTGLGNGTYGAAFITQDGALFLAENSSGNIFKVDIENLSARYIVNGPSTGLNDGASCPNAPSPFIAHIFSKNDSICIEPGGFAFVDILENDEAYLNNIEHSTYELLVQPSFGTVIYDTGSGTISYNSLGTPAFDSLVYAICGDNPKYPACDTATVYFFPPSVSSTTVTLCEGEFYTLGDEIFWEEGTYRYAFTNTRGCDSTVTLNLMVEKPRVSTEKITICAGESYEFHGVTYSEEGTYQQVAMTDHGCMATNTLVLDVVDPVSFSLTETICEGEVYGVGDSLYSTSGQYTTHLSTSIGCDSIVTLHLIVEAPEEIIEEQTICEGESYFFHGDNYSEEGVYQQAGTTPNGCLQTNTLHLQVIPTSFTEMTAIICEGESYPVGDSLYNTTGVFTNILSSHQGCDSVVTVDLAVEKPPEIRQEVSICEGESYTFQGNEFSTEGIYHRPDFTPNGCLRNNILTLHVIPTVSTQLTASLCEGEEFRVGNTSYSESGVFSNVLSSSTGCDSVVTLNLQVAEHSEEEIFVDLCEGETILVGNSEYSQAGVYTDIIPNAAGCDSIITCHVNLHYPSETVIDTTTCHPEKAGTEIITYTDAFGCDSVIIVHTRLLPDNDCFVLAASEGSTLYCNESKGNIAISVSVGTAPFTVTWTGPNAGTATINNLNDTLQISGMPAGRYQISVTDANNHIVQIQEEIIVVEPPTLSTSTSVFADFGMPCQNDNDGIAHVSISGGTPPYSIQWSTGDTIATVENLAPGTYSVLVIDATDCMFEEELTLTAPPPLEVGLEISEIDCFEETQGYIIVEATGGMPPYQYSLNGGEVQSSNTFADLPTGTYRVEIIDSFGCITSEIVWVNVPLPVEVNLGLDTTIMLGDAITLQAIVNMPMYALDTIMWSGLDDMDCEMCLEQVITPLVSTTYGIMVMDSNGCRSEADLTIQVDREIRIYAPNAFSPNGDGVNDIFTLYSNDPAIVEISKLQIFSRWGDQVFTNENFQPGDHSEGWDGNFRGQTMNAAVFAWYAIVETIDGRTELLKGDVTLVR